MGRKHLHSERESAIAREKLRELMRERGWDAKAAAQALGVHYTGIYAFLKGKRGLGDLGDDLAFARGETLDQLLERTHRRPPPIRPKELTAGEPAPARDIPGWAEAVEKVRSVLSSIPDEAYEWAGSATSIPPLTVITTEWLIAMANLWINQQSPADRSGKLKADREKLRSSATAEVESTAEVVDIAEKTADSKK